MVTLAEELYLLAGDAATGRPTVDAAHLDLGLAGALLLDLVLHGRVELVDSHVTVSDPTPTGDPLRDAALRAMTAKTRAREPEYWVRHLAGRTRRAVQDSLLAAGVLRRDAHKILGFVPAHRTHETDGRLHHELVDHLHDAVVLGHPPSRETAALASLAVAVGLGPHLFPRSDRRAVTHRLAAIAQAQCPESTWVADAVAHAVGAADATLGIGPSADSPGWGPG